MEKFSQNRTHCPILNTCFEVYSHIINEEMPGKEELKQY